MARTVRNPLETRTPVRTISSVMRNAPRQRYRPTQLDFGDVPEYGYGRPNRGMGGQQRPPFNQNVTSTLRPAGDSGQAVTGGVNTTRPVSGVTSPSTRPTSNQTSTAVRPATKAPVTSTVKPATKPAAVTKPITTKPTTATKPVTKPVTPVKPITPTTKAPVKPITGTPKPPVAPITKPTTTVTKPTTTTKPSNSLTSTLLKTAAGAGAGALINKVLNGSKTTGGAGGTGPVKPAGGVTRPAGIPSSGSRPATNAATNAATSAVKKAVTPATGAAAKTAQKTAAKAAEIKAENPTLTDEEVQAELDRIRNEEASYGVPEGAVLADDGTYKSTDADGNISTYDKDGNLIGYEGPEAVALTEGEGGGNSTETTGGLTGGLTGGETDTTVVGEDTTGMTDLGEGYFQDGSGNIYSASGDLLYAVDVNGAYYDPEGDLIYDPNAEGTEAEVIDNLEGTEDTEELTSWTDPDSGETWNLSESGLWSLEGDETESSGEEFELGETTLPEDSVAEEDEYVEEDILEEAKGGSIKRKGGLRRFADGDLVYSDTDEEVQPWQNVDYNYGELDDPTLTGYTLTGERNPVGNTYMRAASLADSGSGSSMNGVDVEFFDNGDGTASYWDGNQYVTVDSDTGSELYRTDEDGQIVNATTATSGSSMNGRPVDFTDNGDGTASYWDGDQYVTVDSDTGSELYRTDENGQIVGATNQSARPVTSAGSGQNQSYAAAQAAAQSRQQQNQPDQSGVIDQLLGYVQNNPGLAGGAIGALLSSLLDQAGSGETAMPSQPVDISSLTSFGPRTTDFGPGMTGGRTGTGSSIVSYNDYAEGYGDEVPDDRLYSDLGISGWLREPEMADYTDEQGGLTDRFGNPVDEYGYLLEGVDESAVPEEEAAVEDAYETEEEPAMAAGGPTTHYTFGRVIDPAENLGLAQAQGMKKGGLSQAHTVHSHHTNPVINDRVDFRQGSAVNGAGDGQSDDIPAWLADGEYVMDAELVSMLGNGSNKAGAKVLDKFRESVRAHKRSAPLGKIPPKAKSPLNYLKESMNG